MGKYWMRAFWNFRAIESRKRSRRRQPRLNDATQSHNDSVVEFDGASAAAAPHFLFQHCRVGDALSRTQDLQLRNESPASRTAP